MGFSRNIEILSVKVRLIQILHYVWTYNNFGFKFDAWSFLVVVMCLLLCFKRVSWEHELIQVECNQRLCINSLFTSSPILVPKCSQFLSFWIKHSLSTSNNVTERSKSSYLLILYCYKTRTKLSYCLPRCYGWSNWQ